MSGRSFDLGERLLGFAVTVGEIASALQRGRIGYHVAGQLIRSGTAPAANYAEAEGAESRKDFIYKLRLSLKELRESLFWLRYSDKMSLTNGMRIGSAIRECNELISILVKSIETAKRNAKSQARHGQRQ